MTEIQIAPGKVTLADRLAVSPFLLALLTVFIVVAAEGARGFQTLSAMGVDNDSQVRLVEVRDLLAGQGWFDQQQYRLGMPEGTAMHWSRLVDLPIALIILVASAITGSQAMGENVALVLWPAMTFVAALYLIARGARRFAGDDAMVPATIIGGISLYIVGIFGPGSIDHHNIQLVLTLAALTFLLESYSRPKMAFLAGAAATLTLAVGMETAPYVAFAGLTVAGWYLFKGDSAARSTVNFGLGFATTAVLAFVAAKPPSAWFAVECDAYSIAQFAVAFLGGAGIAVAASMPSMRKTMTRRGLALAGVGALVGVVTLGFFPQCLAAPYADIDPKLIDYWMGSIIEAQPITTVIQLMPVTAASAFPVAIVALAYLAWRIWTQGLRVQDALVAAFLVPAMLVSYYQLRGANFALGFAIMPLAAMVAEQRRHLVANPDLKTNLRVVGAWLVSLNMVWSLAAVMLLSLFQPGYSEAEAQKVTEKKTACATAQDYDQLAALPQARIVAITNLGSSILRYTAHHAYAGPYHRNVAGNLVAIDLLSASPTGAQAIADKNNIDLIVVCRGNAESANYADGTLQTELNAGRAPAWLSIIPESAGANLEIYRVAHN